MIPKSTILKLRTKSHIKRVPIAVDADVLRQLVHLYYNIHYYSPELDSYDHGNERREQHLMEAYDAAELAESADDYEPEREEFEV